LVKKGNTKEIKQAFFSRCERNDSNDFK
jgi:hypothetical protein